MDYLEQIDKIMLNFISELGYEPINLMFSKINSGKKLRSKLLLKITDINEKSLKLCAIIELIHAASLLHDDVIDESDVRRGKPSINATFGSKNAIMLGDILYSKGYFELSKFEPFIACKLSDAVSKLSIGELMDVSMGEAFNEDKNAYMQMIYNKTAVLIEATAQCAAFLQGEDELKFGEYGRNLGLAFQIVDDILDVTQDSKTLGKPALNDYKEGKTTLPYIYLYEILDEKEKAILKNYFKKDLSDEQIFWIKDKFSEHKIIEKCAKDVKNLANSAIEAIKEYENLGLVEVIRSMTDREF
ncbi:polyprenyl synthetase family protein [Campylobacter geochelonis]|uniref:Bifunctional short chain isoprenyl diphosphate synthase n=1 Tax=Campylobacter geochelonis TaxID=1780362 RepID=A0A128EH80_9BACT|nr:polyprenyl synthetase family protein [Campylobacter geochelonis]QKF71451.1 octaprenyl-diphosphate synthase [Campylobacter geochelonis]CZE48319.1 bifunctional short chain isoprenyl diphosphate synthase [Campylobacter geochelonis]CZE50841.1 bifunctional short chain isoprenyl diphosphate synthase [Campylobacter geochelonis]